ncbi:MAG TPA: threonine ammonia-lyase, biosynthetic [bacterium]|nr:threonine ammonia-lyase, biosynthetic [bacterium]
MRPKFSKSKLGRDYLGRVLNAKVYDVAIQSPLEEAPGLSRRLQNRVLLKREDLQSVFSFKLRGAYNKMASLPAPVLQRGVVAASAGNHAQGVALAAQKLGCRALIVMPVTTPDIKVKAVAARGAQVVLKGDSYDDAYHHALELARSRKAAFIHPYDDPAVIAGQGTVGLEMDRQHPGPLGAVFLPIGGGGLAAGVAAYLKQVRPEVKVFGVEPEDSDAMRRSLSAGRRVFLPHVGLFADGVAVKKVGRETFRLCRELLDGILTVDTDDLCAAIKDVFEDTRSILEPAGALSVAGLKQYAMKRGLKNQTLAAVTSGANLNFDRLRFVAERAELGERRESLWAVTIPERPGSFKAFCSLLGRRNVTEFNYRYADARQAHVFVGLQVAGPDEARAFRRKLAKAGLPALNLSLNEMAKLHVRHLVGGRVPGLKNERLFRFEFPERPGALMAFLSNMGKNWNISLFHYRNHGADYGRVLAGIQVPPGEDKAFQAFLKKLGYEYVEETGNPAYSLFLK